MIKLPPEKLGSFYLGARYHVDKNELGTEAVNYDSRDLTTHAVCVGMTGSGKTGLCIGLLEEAAIDQVPAIIIDPKGDMTNLLLQFEDLDADSFKPWINPDDAHRKGMSLMDYAASTADTWTKGLKSWGQDSERIKTLKRSVEYTIYTPGSDAGIPVNILGSFAAPSVNFDEEAEMLRERIQGTVAALLGMIGSKADPVRSREGILLSNLFEYYWRRQEDLDLTRLITSIQAPPIKKLGVFDIETFFPEKERFDLAMAFNTLIASPQFSYWLQGEPLDIEKIYFTEAGKPRHSIFYIAHLSDSERMFFVTLLLNNLITWMRRQSGTTSLRSLLYFDEIFGYFPPTAEPPSKKPLLTLLKQARAFGVGTVLVTQNPVDIDYKGLSNAGTWFIGKLQTERDKDRVLDGLKGALAEAGQQSEADLSTLISSLKSRVFLMHNVHEDAPEIFHTRWVMSYLRGPLTRPQVKTLMAGRASGESRKIPAQEGTLNHEKPLSVQSSASVSNSPPMAAEIDQRFLRPSVTRNMAAQSLGGDHDLKLVYRPMLLGVGKVRFYNAKRNIDKSRELAILAETPDEFGRVHWEKGMELEQWEAKLANALDADAGGQFLALPDTLNDKNDLKGAEDHFSEWLYRAQKISVAEHSQLDLYQGQDESLAAFQMRVSQAAREKRDEEMDALQERYADKLDRVEDKIRREEADLAEQEAELSHRKTAEWVGVAETLISVFAGRRRSFSSAATKSRMRRKAAQRLESTRDEIDELLEDQEELEAKLQEELDEIATAWDHTTGELSTFEVTPRRSDVMIQGVWLVWVPYWENGEKSVVAAW